MPGGSNPARPRWCKKRLCSDTTTLPTPRKHPARKKCDALTPVPSTHMDVGTQRQQDTGAQGPQVLGTSGSGSRGSPQAPVPPDLGLHRVPDTLTPTLPSSSLYSQCTQRLWHRPGERGGRRIWGTRGRGRLLGTCQQDGARGRDEDAAVPPSPRRGATVAPVAVLESGGGHSGRPPPHLSGQ